LKFLKNFYLPLRDEKMAKDLNKKNMDDEINNLKKTIMQKDAEISQLKILIDTIPGDIYWKDKNGVYIGMSARGRESLHKMGFKWHLEDIVGKTDYDLFDKNIAEEYRKHDSEVLQKGIEIAKEEPVMSPSGAKIIQLSTKQPLRNRQGKVVGIIGNTIDITYLKQLEKEIRYEKEASEKANEIIQIITKSLNYIFWKDIHGIYQGCNDNFAHVAGFESPKQVIGKNDLQMKWGKFTAEIYQAEDKEIIETGKPILNKEVPMIVEEGSEQYLSVSKVPLYNDNGSIVGVLGIHIDITRQKETEKKLILAKEKAEKAREAEEKLVKVQYQLEGAKLISSSIAHEIRTPLATIKSGMHGLENSIGKLIAVNQFACKENLPIETVTHKEILDMKKAVYLVNKKVDQSNMIINMLLTKLQSINFEFQEFSICSASQCIQNGISDFIIPDNMIDKVKFNKDHDFQFFGNSTLITHVIMNLLKNAIFYILKANKGEITVWLAQKAKTNEIHFKDTGTGIAPQVLPQIFDSFFTTESSTGTGVGLAFSKMVMHSHQGEISCTSQLGEYTEFILSFPKLDNH